MKTEDHPNDSALTCELRDSVAALAMRERPPLAAITARGRAHQRRRMAGLAGLGAGGAATGTVLALGLTGVLGAAAPAPGAGATGASAPSAGTIRTAAFTLARNANGTDTLTLTRSQMFDPAVLQQALARRGIPALVRTGTYCSSSPAAPDPVSLGVLSIRPRIRPPSTAVPAPGDLKPGGLKPGGLKSGGPKPLDLNRIVAHTETVINPAKMPAGTELFFGYFNSDHALFFDLIHARSYVCASGAQPPSAP